MHNCFMDWIVPILFGEWFGFAFFVLLPTEVRALCGMVYKLFSS
jgi:hypothetical protein